MSDLEPVEQVYKFLDQKNREEAQYPRPSHQRFRPSEAHACSRATYYRHNDVPPKVVPGFVSLYGRDGDLAHTSTHWLMYHAGVDIGGIEFNEETGEAKELDFFRKEVTHNGETFTISGRSDGRVTFNGQEHLLEIKSVDGFKYMHMQKAYDKGELHKYIREGNKGTYLKFLQQSMVACKCLGLESVYLLVKDRSLCQLGFLDKATEHRECGLVIPFEQEMYDATLDKWAAIHKAVRLGEPPMREYTEGSYMCDRLCSYGHICRKE